MRGWTKFFEGTLAQVPVELLAKLEPAQIFHGILEHKWYLSEKQGSDVDINIATQSYVRDILQNRVDEENLYSCNLPALKQIMY